MQEIIKASGNTLFPVFVKLDKVHLLIIGGGLIAYEKIQAVLSSNPNAEVTLVAIDILPEVAAFAKHYPNAKLIRKSFEASDLDGKDLVIAAVNDKALSGEIVAVANGNKTLINVADTPDLCDFYLGSIVKKGNLKIAISTDGKSPTIAKRLKELLADSLPDELDEVLNNMHAIRNRLKGDFATKVSTLNEITKDLVLEGETRNSKRKRDWVMITSLAWFSLYLISMICMLLLHNK